MHLAESGRRAEVYVRQGFLASTDQHVALVLFFDDLEPFHGRLAGGHGPARRRIGQFLQDAVDLAGVGGQAVRQFPLSVCAGERHRTFGVGDGQRIHARCVETQEYGRSIPGARLQPPNQGDENQLREQDDTQDRLPVHAASPSQAACRRRRRARHAKWRMNAPNTANIATA